MTATYCRLWTSEANHIDDDIKKMVVWRRIKNGMSVILLLAFIFYIGYCTKELYTRILNNRKYNRLIEYEKEVSWSLY